MQQHNHTSGVDVLDATGRDGDSRYAAGGPRLLAITAWANPAGTPAELMWIITA